MISKRTRTTRKSHSRYDTSFFISIGILGIFLFTIGILVNGTLHQQQNNHADAFLNCQPDANLVNPCRPWLGAAVAGDPNAASDPVSQFTHFENNVGRQVDIFHDYHPPTGSLPLTSNELHFAQRPNTYIYVNWKPASNWADAGSDNTTVNANIDRTAANIKAIAPTKIFLTIWHEPENDVSSFDNATEQTACQNDPNFKALKGTAGTPAQYQAMWQNVRSRFTRDGVTNVVWVMNYQNYRPWRCLVTSLWPGNNVVDWVTFEGYSSGDSSTWDNVVGSYYNFLTANSNSTTDFLSKPWGVAEFGDCKSSNQSHIYQYYQEAKAALDANTYPNLKMYMVYDSNGNNAGMGCLTDYALNDTADPTEQSYFNQFANDPIFTQSSTATQTPSSTPPLTPVQLLKNGSFENNTTGWLFNVLSPASGTISTTKISPVAGTYAATITIAKADTMLWHAQLKQRNLVLSAEKTYTVTFWAKASTNQEIQAVLQQGQAPNTLYANHRYTLTPQWQKFSYTYTPSSNLNNVFLAFNLAQKRNTIWLDDISFTAKR